jgi:hypothetical protein
LDRAEDWHGENHLNQGTDAHEGESEEELLDQSDDEAVWFNDEWSWAMLGSAMEPSRRSIIPNSSFNIDRVEETRSLKVSIG